MKEYTVTAPDGHEITLEGPDGASDDEVLTQARRLYQPKSAAPSPTLMASRQAASKGEFDANQPESTMLTRGREYLLGGAEGLGANPSSSLLGNAKNIGSSLLNMGQSFIGDPLLGRGTARAQELIGGIGHSMVRGPQDIYEGFKSGDYDRAAHGAGMTTAVDLPAVAGIGEAVQQLKPHVAQLGADIRHGMAGGKVPYVEQALAPTGLERKAITAEIAPKLAEDPLVANVKKALMDKAVYNKFTTASGELEAAAKSVPRGTTVAKQPLLDELKSAINEQSTFASNPEIVASEGGKRILGDWYNKLSKLPDQIPFDELRKFRQDLDKEIAVHGGWKETASLADRTEMVANRKVVNAIRGQLKGVSQALDKADEAYSLASDAMNAAGLDRGTGRRLANVGKTAPPGIIRKAVTSPITKGAAGGLIGAGLARGIYNLLE